MFELLLLWIGILGLLELTVLTSVLFMRLASIEKISRALLENSNKPIPIELPISLGRMPQGIEKVPSYESGHYK